MTLANKVTIGRILLIPGFVIAALSYRQTAVESHRWIALSLFLTAAVSDGVDGWIARRFNQRSQLGAMLDPLADKLLLLSALIVLSQPGVGHVPALPFWFVASVLSRDAILVLGMSVIHFTCGHVAVIPRVTGKTATLLQMVLVVATLADLFAPYREGLTAATLLITLISGVQYSCDGLAQLAASPKSSADADAGPPPNPNPSPNLHPRSPSRPPADPTG